MFLERDQVTCRLRPAPRNRKQLLREVRVAKRLVDVVVLAFVDGGGFVAGATVALGEVSMVDVSIPIDLDVHREAEEWDEELQVEVEVKKKQQQQQKRSDSRKALTARYI